MIKRNPLYYIVAAIMFLCFIFMAWPNILGWNTAEIWVMGIPLSQFCIYLFPLLIALGMGALYLLDKQYEKAKAKERALQEKGSEHQC